MRSLGKTLVWLAGAIIIVALVYNVAAKSTYPLEYTDLVLLKSNENNIPRNLILAVIREESRFKPEQVSKVGAVGLMQVMPKTAEWIAEKRGIKYDANKLSDPDVNIDLGVWYIRYLYNQFDNNDTLAIEAYNAGITNVMAWEKKNPNSIEFAETEAFVKRVKKSWEKYDTYYGANWER